MEWLTNLFSAGNPLIGGIVGVLGSAFTGWMNYKSQKLKYDNDAKIRRHELDVIGAETAAQVKIVETQTKGAVDLADSNAYRESQKYGNITHVSSGVLRKLTEMKNNKGGTHGFAIVVVAIITFMLSLVDFLKGIMRPGLTAYHVVLTTYITAMAWSIIEAQKIAFAADDAMAIVVQVVNTVLFLTVTCVTWWFGDRRMAKFLMRLNDGNIK